MEHEPAAWDYAEIVRRFLRPTDRVLDLGTGGGERFIALSDAYAHGIGVDHKPDVVIWVEQIVSVLRPSGYFIGQEGGERYNQPI